MLLRIMGFLIFAMGFAVHAEAHDHANHPPHNMVLFGQDEIFVSHIVYKKPHNYQVILRVRLNQIAQKAYTESRRANPNDLHIFLFDSMDIGTIQAKPRLTGKFLRQTDQGTRTPFLTEVALEPDQYELIFFDELPLSLEK